MTDRYQLTGVRKAYATRVALDLDTLTLAPGQLYILTGPNGSGKSTLLNILAFLMTPDSGEIVFNGDRVRSTSEALTTLRKKVTLLHQSPLLFAGSVEFNVGWGLRLRQCSDTVVRAKVSESLALVGMEGLQTRNVKHLSGGERRRVALARALALTPEVLLLDEPLANVDKTTARQLERVIGGLPRNGTTVMMSTHYMHYAEHLDGNVIALEDGKLDIQNCRFHTAQRDQI